MRGEEERGASGGGWERERGGSSLPGRWSPLGWGCGEPGLRTDFGTLPLPPSSRAASTGTAPGPRPPGQALMRSGVISREPQQGG